jgi:hypothetical protein
MLLDDKSSCHSFTFKDAFLMWAETRRELMQEPGLATTDCGPMAVALCARILDFGTNLAVTSAADCEVKEPATATSIAVASESKRQVTLALVRDLSLETDRKQGLTSTGIAVALHKLGATFEWFTQDIPRTELMESERDLLEMLKGLDADHPLRETIEGLVPSEGELLRGQYCEKHKVKPQWAGQVKRDAKGSVCPGLTLDCKRAESFWNHAIEHVQKKRGPLIVSVNTSILRDRLGVQDKTETFAADDPRCFLNMQHSLVVYEVFHSVDDKGASIAMVRSADHAPLDCMPLSVLRSGSGLGTMFVGFDLVCVHQPSVNV